MSNIQDSLQPTMIFQPEAEGTKSSSVDVSRAQVGFVAGERAQFSDETAALLRSRLTAAAILMSCVMSAAFVGNLVAGMQMLWFLRFLVLATLITSAVLLRSQRRLTLQQLRITELVLFGSVTLQLSMMLTIRLHGFAETRDATSMISLRQQFLMAWCLLIFIYGTLIPNTWKRGALVMLPVSVLPYILTTIESFRFEPIAELLSMDRAKSPLPLPIVAAVIATFASHTINTSRREAFKARRFGQYRLMEKLGAGGMGEVYKAEHMLLKRPCAIKLIRTDTATDAAAIARFEKEVKTTAQLTHWNTVEIYDYGRTDDGTFYYVMELLPGMSLEDLVHHHGPLPAERVVYLLKQICGALEEAHSVGLIHRDIKPANIFVSQRGGVFDVAKLLDFGLVKESSGGPDAEAAGSFSGTPLFMSPEQALTYNEVDGRADLYSLGAVAYFLLTGKTPFTSHNVLELLAAHRNAAVLPPSQLKSSIPAELDSIVLRCLAKSPRDRFQTAEELRKALEQCSTTSAWDSDHARTWWQNLRPHPLAIHTHPTANQPLPSTDNTIIGTVPDSGDFT